MVTRSLLPVAQDEHPASSSKWNGAITRTYLVIRRRPYRAIFIVFAFLLVLFNTTAIGTIRRDLIYLIRPLWDNPEPPFTTIPHYPAPVTGKADWCHLHGWTPRPMTTERQRPMIIDAVPIATELDMLEVRMREYAPFVDIFVIVESLMTHSGHSKSLHFARERARFDKIAEEGGARIVYAEVEGMERDLPVGSFSNEIKQRKVIAELLSGLRDRGEIPDGSLVIQSDVDEIISRDTLDLLGSCQGYPGQMHLNVKNYRYSFDYPLLDQGYWRPRVVTVTEGQGITYHHGRGSDWLLAGAGWHCSFCFPTLEDMRKKMMGYVHNDRVRDKGILDEKVLREKVCNGEDPFGMYPVRTISPSQSFNSLLTDGFHQEAFTFKDVLAQSGPVRQANSFVDVPSYLQKHPERFPYMLGKGCDRPDHPE